jgi:hypothetical protein
MHFAFGCHPDRRLQPEWEDLLSAHRTQCAMMAGSPLRFAAGMQPALPVVFEIPIVCIPVVNAFTPHLSFFLRICH